MGCHCKLSHAFCWSCVWLWQANKLEPEGTAVQKLVSAQPAGKSFFKEQNGAVSLSSDPQTAGQCPFRFSGISPLFWDRVRSVFFFAT